MSGQAAAMSREEVRKCIKEVECNHGTSKGSGGGHSHPMKEMKTTNNK